jgi:hypothetical protein
MIKAFPIVMQLAIIAMRVALWLGIFSVMLFGLFTVPVIMVCGFLLTYILLHYYGARAQG